MKVDSDVVGILKKAGAVISALVLFLTSLLTFIALVKDQVTLVVATVTVISIGALWLASAYLWFATDPTPNILLIPGTDSLNRKPKYSHPIRRAAIVVMFLIPLLFLAAYLVSHRVARASKTTVVLVANMDGSDPSKFHITDLVLERLRTESRHFSDLDIQAVEQSITEQSGGSTLARQIGKDRKADIVIWGFSSSSASNALVDTHFEVLRESFDPSLMTQGETLNRGATELNSFQLQSELGDKFAYLTFLTIGIARFKATDYTDAVSLLTAAIDAAEHSRHPNDATVPFFYRGLASLSLSHYGQAISDLRRCVQLSPADSIVHYDLGLALELNSQTPIAVTEYTEAIKLNSTLAEAYFNRAGANLRSDNLQAAIQDYTSALSLKPPFIVETYINRGNALAAAHRFDEAMADLNQALNIQPNSDLALFDRGNVRIESYSLDTSEAIRDYSAALQQSPTLWNAYANRGTALALDSQYEAAIGDYNRAIALAKDKWYLFYIRGLTFMMIGFRDEPPHGCVPNHDLIEPKYVDRCDPASYRRNLSEALDDFGRALALSPLNAEVLYARSAIYWNQGDVNRSMADLDGAISADPNDTRALVRRAAFRFQRAKSDPEVLDDLNSAVHISPKNYDAFNARGNVYFELNNFEMAIQDFTEAISIDPKNERAYFGRAMAYQKQGKTDLAMKDFIKSQAVMHFDSRYFVLLSSLYSDRRQIIRSRARPSKP